MTNRQSHRQRFQEQRKKRRQILIIIGVVAAALIVAGILIAKNPPPQSTVIGTILPAPAITFPQPNGKSLGPKTAKVVVMEFADFQCVYCKQFHDIVFPQIVSTYIATGKIQFEYHHFIVIDGNVGGTHSEDTAEASDCANDQGKFWDFFNIAFANQGTEGSDALSDARLKAFAANLGLDTTKFNSCLDSHQFSAQVTQDVTLALSLKLNSTPSLLVNNVAVSNPLDFPTIQTAIDAAIKQAGG